MMPRRYHPSKRQIEPDIRYHSVIVAQFINKMMKQGKKSIATRIMYDALDLVQDRMKQPPLEVMEEAVRNVSPVLEVRPRRVGGSTYQIPVEVPPHRQVSLAMRWLLTAAHDRPGKSMTEKLANELMDAARGTGAAVRRKENTHKMAEANRAFAQYRW